MLDWQGKKWIKAIAVIVVFAFMTYDIAWAMDFTPMRVSNVPTTETPGLLSRVGDFISKSVLKKSQQEEQPEDTDILQVPAGPQQEIRRAFRLYALRCGKGYDKAPDGRTEQTPDNRSRAPESYI